MSVKLPKRSEAVRESTERSPVWTLASSTQDATGTASSGTTGRPSSYGTVQPPLKSMCDVHSRPDAVCCRTLKGDDERTLIDQDIMRDIIIGLSDGLTVPFGLTAGLAAIGSSRIVVVGGIAELISGALSMGIGGFLSAQAERDHYRYLRRTTRQRVARSCAGELEREVSEVLGGVGLEESICRRVAVGLMKVEGDLANPQEEAQERGLFQSVLHSLARKPKTTLEDGSASSKLSFSDDVGLTAFLLKFGEGLEEVPNSRLFISAFTIGSAYAVGGFIPLLPYIIVKNVRQGLYYSVGLTAIVLVIFGILKAYYTGAKVGLAGYTSSAIYTLLVGALAAGSSYAICAALEA